MITACRYFETSSAGHPISLFTRHFLAGIGCNTSGSYTGSMPADTSGDQLITLYEAYLYARDHAYAEDNGQTALRYGGDSYILFRRK